MKNLLRGKTFKISADQKPHAQAHAYGRTRHGALVQFLDLHIFICSKVKTSSMKLNTYLF